MSLPKSEYNLLREEWIRVLGRDCVVREVSLMTLFERAHEYRDLGGELPTQDVAVLRLLLAILHAVFARVDRDGHAAPIADYNGALDRWQSLWDMGRFPVKPIADYLMRYEDRFRLFDEDRPFYQVKEAENGTEYGAAKLNGELSESANKIRLFPSRTSQTKIAVGFAEAARWLLYVNGYDDTSAKPKQKNLPSPGAGWLGKLGLIQAVGDNLFETMMMNLVLLKNGETLWGKEKPLWEQPNPNKAERTEILCPNNPSELYTLQSRRLLLKREGDTVLGYTLLGGDFFDKTNAMSEQMTVWALATKENQTPRLFKPKRHDPSRQMWRDFSTIFKKEEIVPRPGVVSWLSRLTQDEAMSRRQLRFRIASVQYGDKDFFVTDVFSDELTLQATLLQSLGVGWIGRIEHEIDLCNDVAFAIGALAKDLCRASGKNGKKDDDVLKACATEAKEQFYYRIDAPFRAWLRSIDPSADVDKDKVALSWRSQARAIALALGKEMVERTGTIAFIGRRVEDATRKDAGKLYSAPQAYNRFLYRMSRYQ